MVQEAIPSNVGLRGVPFCIMPLLDPDPAFFNIKQVETSRYCFSPTFRLLEQAEFSPRMNICEIPWGNMNSLY